MNRISIELLKISGRLEEAGLKEPASELAMLAETLAKTDRLLTVTEAAEWLGCGRRTLDQMISERRIPAHLIGGRYRLLSQFGDNNSTLAKIHYLTTYDGHRLQELESETVEDSQVSIFIDNVSFLDLRKTAAYELFDLYYPEEYKVWERSSCDGLIFDEDRFLDSPIFHTAEFQIAEDRILVVEPR